MHVFLQSVLDEMGAEAGCTTMNQEGELVVARPEAVYLYTLDGRGPCFVFDGTFPLTPHLCWHRQQACCGDLPVHLTESSVSVC